MTIENAEPPKAPEKGTYRLIAELVLVCVVVLLEIRFFSETTNFIEKISETVGLGWGFRTLFWLIQLILSFGFLQLTYEALLTRLKATPVHSALFLKLLIFNSLAAIFCSFFWLIQAKGIIEATIYELENFRFFLCGFIIYICYFVSKDSLKSAASLANGLKYAFSACFVWVCYFSLCVDDGCVTTGADPLFGGGGETHCDPEYVEQRDQLYIAGSARGFNSNAAFAVQYLWMTTVSFLTITLDDIFKIKPNEQC